MQVKDEEFIEAAHEAAAHAPERGVVEIAMVGDESQDALARLVDLPLGVAQEFYVVIAQPFRLRRFLEFRTSLFICVQ